MALTTYRKKRRFEVTPEPRGKAAKRTRAKPLQYVIQKHDATRLHYDFRLELDGVMKSWAVPKGPSLDPAVKRMAVHVEDHPIEYNTFEGVIPKGEYGGGPVLLWDRGTWIPEEDPRRGYREGVLKFRLKGKKLHGSWVLVRTRGLQGKKEQWLLIKQRDEAASPGARTDVVATLPRSVASGRTIEEIGPSFHRRAAGKAPAATNLAGEGRRASLPRFVPPVLATLVESAPPGDGWVHEIKYDGYRALCRIAQGKARIYTRRGNDWTGTFAAPARAAEQLPVRDAWLDGEIVVLRPNGLSSFTALQEALSGVRGAGPMVYYLFDLPFLEGRDLRRLPLIERKRLLRDLLEASGKRRRGVLRYSDHVEGQGEAFFEQACRSGLEGIIAKRADSPYRAGRGRDWLKVKCVQTRELAVVGYTDPEGARQGFGALVLGEAQDGRLVHVGRVGTGFSDRVLRTLTPRLRSLKVAQAAVTPVPRGAAARGVHWIRPELVADVAFTERTRDGILRHPVFRGLREDKTPKETAGEAKGIALDEALSAAGKKAAARPARAVKSRAPAPAQRRAPSSPRAAASKPRPGPAASGLKGMRLTNPDKLLYPESGISKRKLVDYYLEVQERLFPYLEGRPLTIRRCPDGYDKFCFWEKHLDDLPHGLRAISLDDPETEKERGAYFYAASMEGVLGLVQLGALEMHVWGSRAARVEYPDLMIFDVDPDAGLPWKPVVEACATLRDRLHELGLKSWLKTTGGKGLHVCVPLSRRQRWDEVKEFSKAVAENMAAAEPARYTLNPLKARRKGRIFLDYLRNGRGATSIAAYSTRARPGAPISMPLAWEELDGRLRPDAWTVANVGKRLRDADPWRGFYACRQSITGAMRRAVGAPGGSQTARSSAIGARLKSLKGARSKSAMGARSTSTMAVRSTSAIGARSK